MSHIVHIAFAVLIRVCIKSQTDYEYVYLLLRQIANVEFLVTLCYMYDIDLQT